MVIVSKGCDSCRASKVRCDQTQPQCGRCTRTGKECRYRDPKDLVFRDVTDHTIKRSQRQIAYRAAINEARHLESLSPTQIGPDIHELCANYFFQTNLPPAVNSGPMMRHQVISSYCRDYFPRIKCTNDIDTSHFVFLSIFGLPQKSLMLETACSALGYIFQGRIRRDEHVLQYGVGLYNQAIRLLAHAISQKSDYASTEDIVYTCVIFQQVQVHYSPHSLGEWLAHIDGLSAIMRHFGSTIKKLPSTQLLNTIFGEHQKFQVALTGFMHLSDDSIAWLKEPNKGGTWFDYLELLTELSRITKAITTTKPSDHDAFVSLLADCLELERKNMNFWTKINPEGEPQTFAPGELQTGIASTDDLFGPAYRFSSLDDAILHALLFTSLSFVYPLIRQCRTLVEKDSSIAVSTTKLKDKEHQLSLLYVSKSIRCLPYCGQEGMNSWGMAYAVWVATQASRVYTHVKDWERFLWAQDVLVYMDELGFGFAARFRDMWGNYWFETHRHNEYRVMSLRTPVKSIKHPSLRR